MGIRFLETYVRSDVPGGYFKIDIEKEVEKWKRQNVGKSPLIVIDFMALDVHLDNGNVDKIFGKRHHLIIKKHQELFDKLKALQVEMVFFIDGPPQQVKMDTFIDRHENRYSNSIDIFDRLEAGQSIDTIIKSKVVGQKNDIPASTTTFSAIANLCRRYGLLFTSIYHECDAEVAQYATQNNALAVISNDTDFLIFEGNWKYWSGKQIDVDKLQTIEYSRSAFRQSIGLAKQQLPLFATVSGNDICRFDDLKVFHYRLKCGRHDRFLKLANYVRYKPINLTLKDLISISSDIWAKASPETTEILRQSLDSYNLNFQIKLPDSEFKRKVAQQTTMYQILEDIPYNLNLCFFDLRRTESKEFMSYGDIVEPLLRRLMGVLCQHTLDEAKSKELKRTIVVKKSHTEIPKPYLVNVLFPKIIVPDLMTLTFTDQNANLNPIRWQLLKWIIFAEHPIHFLIENIPVEHIVGTLTTLYLLKLNQITTIEADAILLANDHVHRDLVPEKIKYIPCPDGRDIMVAHLYTHVYGYIRTAMELLGLKSFIQHLIFDGVYFVNLLWTNKGLADAAKYDEATQSIQHLRLYYDLI